MNFSVEFSCLLCQMIQQQNLCSAMSHGIPRGVSVAQHNIIAALEKPGPKIARPKVVRKVLRKFHALYHQISRLECIPQQ
jgi:hypothetical protein